MPTLRRPALRAFVRAALVGGIAAGIAAGLAQVALWVLFTEEFPAVLWRDVRLTAAIALGSGVLGGAAPLDWTIIASATFIHFWLSVLYAAVFFALCDNLSLPASAAVGALLGVLLYFVNMYGFTAVFPWFEAARDWITVAAHVVFGVVATVAAGWAAARERRRPAATG